MIEIEIMITLIDTLKRTYSDLMTDEDINKDSKYYVRLEAKKEVLSDLMHEYDERIK